MVAALRIPIWFRAMGVLDDAIREHLELKRRHGVPEDEVQRQEEEALGPARREVARQPEDAETAAAADETALFDGETAAGSAAEAGAEAPPAEPDEHAAEAEPLAATPEEAAPHEPFADAPAEHEPFADAPAAALDHARPAHDSVADDAPPEPLAPGQPLADDEELPFAAEDFEDEEPDAPEDEPEDVLEDTPDFLQETPEHDRLWFEQKPPRDFDFD